MRGTCIIRFEGDVSREVEADIFGEWAVHVGPSWVHYSRNHSRPANTITHVPSGMRASCSETCGISKREAQRIARHLARTIPAGRTVDEAFGFLVWEQILVATYGDPLPPVVRDDVERRRKSMPPR